MTKVVVLALLISIFMFGGNCNGQSNTTTTAAPTTTSTTAAPTTTSTTAAPTTTSTTVAPTTTSTTVAPTTTSTTAAPTTTSTKSTPLEPTSSTTVVPVTTEVPEPTPKTGHFVVEDDKNVTCIRAKMAVVFTIPDLKGKSHYLTLSPNATTEGSNCNVSENVQELVLNDENVVFTLIFEKDSNNVYVRNITLSYTIGSLKGYAANSTVFFTVKLGNSYQCNSNTKIPLENVLAEVSDFRIEAFGKEGQKDFNIAEECESDNSISDVVPIAVGCALGALIIVVLIAYLVGRRKSRQRGYQSV